jgi:alpha-galactosidase
VDGRPDSRIRSKVLYHEDAGVKTFAKFRGSWNFFQKDADTFAKWKVDYIKLDGCNVPDVAGQTTEQTY